MVIPGSQTAWILVYAQVRGAGVGIFGYETTNDDSSVDHGEVFARFWTIREDSSRA